MHIEKIEYKTEENGKWRIGYMIGTFLNSSDTTILDEKFHNVRGTIWDLNTDLEDKLIIDLPTQIGFELD